MEKICTSPCIFHVSLMYPPCASLLHGFAHVLHLRKASWQRRQALRWPCRRHQHLGMKLKPRHTSQFWICDLLLIHFDPFWSILPVPTKAWKTPSKTPRPSEPEPVRVVPKAKTTKATKTIKPKEKPKATIKKAIGTKKSSWLKVGTKMEAAESCVNVTTCRTAQHMQHGSKHDQITTHFFCPQMTDKNGPHVSESSQSDIARRRKRHREKCCRHICRVSTSTLMCPCAVPQGNQSCQPHAVTNS